ncbi:MAG: AAA family ATPase [Succinivibrio sp.]|nr:AAA family ATPase [Succinivibrio sp.]
MNYFKLNKYSSEQISSECLSARQADPEALVELARRSCFADFNTPFDPEKGFKLLKEARSQDTLILKTLAECCQNGIGTSCDLKQAAAFYLLKANCSFDDLYSISYQIHSARDYGIILDRLTLGQDLFEQNEYGKLEFLLAIKHLIFFFKAERSDYEPYLAKTERYIAELIAKRNIEAYAACIYLDKCLFKQHEPDPDLLEQSSKCSSLGKFCLSAYLADPRHPCRLTEADRCKAVIRLFNEAVELNDPQALQLYFLVNLKKFNLDPETPRFIKRLKTITEHPLLSPLSLLEYFDCLPMFEDNGTPKIKYSLKEIQSFIAGCTEQYYPIDYLSHIEAWDDFIARDFPEFKAFFDHHGLTLNSETEIETEPESAAYLREAYEETEDYAGSQAQTDFDECSIALEEINEGSPFAVKPYRHKTAPVNAAQPDPVKIFSTISNNLKNLASFAASDETDGFKLFCQHTIIDKLKHYDAYLKVNYTSLGPYLIRNAQDEMLNTLAELGEYLGSRVTQFEIIDSNYTDLMYELEHRYKESEAIIIIDHLERLSDLQISKEDKASSSYKRKAEPFDKFLMKLASCGRIIFLLSRNSSMSDVIEDKAVFEAEYNQLTADPQHTIVESFSDLPFADNLDLNSYQNRLENLSYEQKILLRKRLQHKLISENLDCISNEQFKSVCDNLNRLKATSLPPQIFKDNFELIGNRELSRFIKEHIIKPLTTINEEGFVEFPESILLYGKPGTGKTVAMEKLAHYLGFAVFKLNAASLYSSFIHDTSIKINHIFAEARSYAPSVMIIDELDAFMSRRDNLSQSELEEISEFLRLICKAKDNHILIIGTTNRIKAIDEAILREGRISLSFEVKNCSREDIRDLLKLKLTEHNLTYQNNLDNVLRRYTGCSIATIDSIFEDIFTKITPIKDPDAKQNKLNFLLSTHTIRTEDWVINRRIGFI